MAKREESNAAKIKAATDSLVNCLDAVEAAFKDLRSSEIQFARLPEANSPPFQHRLANRILTAALSLQRLEDAARRLLKRLGHDMNAFQKLLSSSTSIRVTSKLANSWKHGLGGQHKNSTLLNGLLTVHRNDGWKDETGVERVHILGMMVTDAVEGAFSSTELLTQCVKDWAAVLQSLVPEARTWAERVAPTPQGSVIKVNTGSKPVLPLGSTVVFDIQADLRNMLAAEAKRRSESA